MIKTFLFKSIKYSSIDFERLFSSPKFRIIRFKLFSLFCLSIMSIISFIFVKLNSPIEFLNVTILNFLKIESFSKLKEI